jgi:hypothetical protein
MKFHLAANKGIDKAVFAMCAGQSTSSGKVRHNSRATYRTIPECQIVRSLGEFEAIEASERCAHCVDRGLIVRNRQRAAKGLPKVDSLFARTEAA